MCSPETQATVAPELSCAPFLGFMTMDKEGGLLAGPEGSVLGVVHPDLQIHECCVRSLARSLLFPPQRTVFTELPSGPQ